MPQVDPSHWLYRLAPADWLRAAATELDAATAAFARHGHRAAVTHCRRAAGMALNAVLWQGERPAWGRSYMEHVVALAIDAAAPPEVSAAAQALRTTPAAPPALVQIGRRDALDPAAQALLAATRTVIDWAAAVSSGETGT